MLDQRHMSIYNDIKQDIYIGLHVKHISCIWRYQIYILYIYINIYIDIASLQYTMISGHLGDIGMFLVAVWLQALICLAAFANKQHQSELMEIDQPQTRKWLQASDAASVFWHGQRTCQMAYSDDYRQITSTCVVYVSDGTTLPSWE